MTEHMELIYQWLTLSVQIFFGTYFFARFLRRKIKLCFYLPFSLCAAWVIYSVPGGTMAELAVFALLLAAAGIWAGRADWRPAVLYAVLVVEIMQLCYGIVNSLLSILYPFLSAFDQKAVGLVFMMAGEMTSLLLAGFCYGMVRRRFAEEMYSFHYGIYSVLESNICCWFSSRFC